MKLWLAALLGLVQGLTEFLPVSSSGHLALVSALFGSDPEADYMLFFVLLHFGTLISVVIAFRKDVLELIVEFFGMCRDGFKVNHRPYRRFIVMLIFSILPMFVMLPFKSKLESFFTSTTAVGVCLLLTALILFLSDRFPAGRKTEKSSSYLDGLIVGVFQCFALLPGVSRSGTTMVGGLSRGFTREFALRFAFIMSLPVVFGANLLEVGEALAAETPSAVSLPCYIVGVLVAMVSGLAAIRLVKLVANRGNFRPFSIYCAVVGAVTIVVSLIK